MEDNAFDSPRGRVMSAFIANCGMQMTMTGQARGLK